METAPLEERPKLINRFRQAFKPAEVERKPRAGDMLAIGGLKYLVATELGRGRLIIKPAQDKGRRGSR
jgi:hypothetical protein